MRPARTIEGDVRKSYARSHCERWASSVPYRQTPNSHTVNENTIKWILFGLMCATVPVLYFMFVIGGFLPLIAIVAMSFTGTWGFALFNAIHVLIYGAAFYWVVKVVSNKLASLPRAWKILGFATVSLALVSISFLPLYGVGHSEYQPVNLYRLHSILK